MKPSVWGPLGVHVGGSNLAVWVKNLQKQINFVRREERRYDASLDGYVADDWLLNPTAFVHRMQNGDQAPEVSAVVDPLTGRLVTDPAEVARVFRDHFQSVLLSALAMKRSDPHGSPSFMVPPRRVLTPHWYAGFMAPISEVDVRDALSGAKLVCAAGQDRISSGIWRCWCNRPLCSSIACLFYVGCVAHRFQPAAAKHAIIVPV